MTVLEEHLIDANTHRNLIIDGNVLEPSAFEESLSEHKVDETAHQNLIFDGNK